MLSEKESLCPNTKFLVYSMYHVPAIIKSAEDVFHITINAPNGCKAHISPGISVNNVIFAMKYMIDNGMLDVYNFAADLLQKDPKVYKLSMSSNKDLSAKIKLNIAVTKPSLFSKYVKITFGENGEKNSLSAKGKVNFKGDAIPEGDMKYWTASKNKEKIVYTMDFKIPPSEFNSKKQELCSIIEGIKDECELIRKMSS